jgi:hypothetical protein
MSGLVVETATTGGYTQHSQALLPKPAAADSSAASGHLHNPSF